MEAKPAVEEVGDIATCTWLDHHIVIHDRALVGEPFRTDFGDVRAGGDELIKGYKIRGRIQEINILVWSWWDNCPGFFRPSTEQPRPKLCCNERIKQVRDKSKRVSVHTSILYHSNDAEYM